MIGNINVDDGIAIFGALGALGALYVSMQDAGSGGSWPSTIDLRDHIPEDSVDTSNPDGSETDPDWLGDVGDSAPDPDGGTDTSDGPTLTNPDGSETDSDWLGDVSDSGSSWTYEGDEETQPTSADDTTTGGTTRVGETGIDFGSVWEGIA